MAAGPGTASPEGLRLGNLLIEHVDVGAVTALLFCLGGAVFYVMLYRSRIAPRWIVLWGLVAIPFYVAAYLFALYGVIGSESTAQTL